MLVAESQEKRWEMLTKQYRQGGVALVLGAGVSTGSNIPDWGELIRRVADARWGPTGRNIVDDLLAAGMTLPTITGILAAERRDVDFPKLLRAALYRDFPFKQILNSAAERKRLVSLVHRTNSTLRAVAAFCAAKRDEAFIANPAVHAVITSNVDAVLRTYVRARYDDWLLRTIETAKHSGRRGRIPTYYMHGFLHFVAKGDDEEQTPLVFTEAEYFDFFNRPLSVFNYTFLYILREYHCVFIGMSMKDQNIRRLLHYSAAERRAGSDADPRRTGLRHFALLPRSESAKVDKHNDLALRLLGTRALWIDSFADIPVRLGDLYGKADWPSVY